jgi:aminoglycoside phosphotransferase family enzyme/predicted kinase
MMNNIHDHPTQPAQKEDLLTPYLKKGASASVSLNFAEMLNLLQRPEAFPFSLPETLSVTVIQTHASAVLLTSELVYKLKKPKNFGFFDYSTPSLRRHFCQREVCLNEPLASGIYLGVAPVLLLPGEQLRFGATLAPEAVPQPGTKLDGGRVVDYAVVTRRLPDEAMLATYVQDGRATTALMADVACFIAEFHQSAMSNEQVAHYGEMDLIRRNWEENFAQMRPHIGQTITAEDYEKIVAYVHRFLLVRAPLFASRLQEQRIRDCHGDLRLQHVYIYHDRFLVLDRIEFAERYRYGDVAGEVAFLVMELEAVHRTDLARAFVAAYIDVSGDAVLRELLPFYSCYRACVRGKVSSLQLDDVTVPAEQREEVRQQAAALFELAACYANRRVEPILLLVGGLMGTGKSSLALALQQELDWAYFSSDIVRKYLAGVDPVQPQMEDFGQGLYSAEWTELTYETLCAEAGACLAASRSVLIDATFLRRAHRVAMAREAALHGAHAVFVECRCPPDVVLERLQRRAEHNLVAGKGASLASDGYFELYETHKRHWEAFFPEEESGMQHIVIDTTAPLSTFSILKRIEEGY